MRAEGGRARGGERRGEERRGVWKRERQFGRIVCRVTLAGQRMSGTRKFCGPPSITVERE